MIRRELGRRIDFHVHSLLSDGVLIPSEIARRARVLGHRAVAITDHVDPSNLEGVVRSLTAVAEAERVYSDFQIIPGVELTHVPPKSIPSLAAEAKRLGAKIVVVHGETPTEPVELGTNSSAVRCLDVDILAHPGLISLEDANTAKDNNVFLEISARKGHCLTNGHVARVGMKVGARMLVNTDAHEPDDLIDQEYAYRVALGASMDRKLGLKVVTDFPLEMLRKVC
jgi:histidinol phosphatase-like PHP family hydrolase